MTRAPGGPTDWTDSPAPRRLSTLPYAHDQIEEFERACERAAIALLAGMPSNALGRSECDELAGNVYRRVWERLHGGPLDPVFCVCGRSPGR